MSFASACQSLEAARAAQVYRETWGHLAPKRNKTYTIKAVWALGCFGSDSLNPTVISCEMPGLDSSPWFYNALLDFLRTQSKEEGAVLRFEGTFKNYRFDGVVERVGLI